MRLIDEAVAATVSGVVADPWAAAEIYCTLFGACELVVDVRRAQAWLDAVDNYVERTGELPVFGICRMHYGGVLTAAGRWADAERELLAALGVYDATYRGTRFEPLLRLADLRVRQGRLEEARQLLAGHEAVPEAAPPRVRLHLAQGQPEIAATLARRHLAHRGRGLVSAPVLAMLVEAELACAEIAGARLAAAELAELAEWCRQPSVRGLAALSQARVAVAAGEQAAVALFERALAAFAEAELPCELARARLELAQAVAATEPQVARAEARAAFACFQEVGAARDADAAASLLRRLGDHRGRSGPKGFGTLTKRETEILRLLAEGLSNRDIAERLYISPRTAEHHVGNILSKLGLSNRAEAAAYAQRTRSIL
jgi:DNA-binding CsgD family transcriptional regulator